MVEDSKDIRNQHLGSGSHSKPGQREPIQRSDQGDPGKKDEQGQDKQPGPLTQKKDVQKKEREQESRKTGTH